MFTLAPSKKKTFSPRRAVRYQWIRLVRLRGDPLVIARGIAVGIFVGMTPTIPFHTTLTILFCWIFRANLIAALILNLMVSNPLTIPMEYYLSWKLGTLLSGSSLGSWHEVQSLLADLSHASFVEGIKIIGERGVLFFGFMSLGGMVLGLPFAAMGYMAYLRWSLVRQKRRYERLSMSSTERERETGIK